MVVLFCLSNEQNVYSFVERIRAWSYAIVDNNSGFEID